MTAEQHTVFADFCLDPINACLWRNAKAIHLTPKVYAVLSYLLRHAGRVVTREELLAAVWPDTIVGEAVLTVCIREIRKVLGDEARAPQFVETRHRLGYRFIAPVTQITTGSPTQHVRLSEKRNAARRSVVGRESELLQLRNWLDKALCGERQLVFVTGEPGIGKTTLVDAFCRHIGARDDLWTARGQCFEHHGVSEAYLPVLEALNQLCRQRDGQRLVKLLGRQAPMWLAQLPWLGTTSEQAKLRRETLGATPQRMLREIVEALESVTAQTPLVLVLEDLHWSDNASLDLLSALARRREPARLLLVATYRPVDVIVNDHPLHNVKQQLHAHGRCDELLLELLSEAAVAEYLGGRFGEGALPADLARLIHERTGGNPFFMVSVVDDLVARGVLAPEADGWRLQGEVEQVEVAAPEGIRATIENQLSRLPPNEQRLLEAASVAGMEFSAAAVADTLQRDIVATEEVYERLARRQLFLCAAGVTEWPNGTVASRYRFRHWLQQDVLYRRVPAARRQQLHLQMGQRLKTAYGTSAGTIAAELAQHFQRGGEVRLATDYLSQAAENACRRYAHREAFDCLQRALELAGRLPEEERQQRTAVIQQRGRLRRETGDMAGAAEDFIAAAAAAGESSGAGVLALLDAASTLYFIDHAQCLTASDQALKHSKHVQDRLLRAHAQGQAAHWNIQLRGWRDKDARAFNRALDTARQAHDTSLLGLYLTLSVFHRCHQSRYEAACAAANEALPLLLAAGDGYNYMACLAFQSWALLHLGRWGETVRVVERGLKVAEKNGHQLAASVLQFFNAWLHEQAFDFAGARNLCQPLMQQAWNGASERAFGLIRLGVANLGLGQHDEALKCFHQLTDLLDRGDVIIWIWRMHLHHGLSECLLARGDLVSARREAELTCTLATQSDERTYLALGKRTLAEIALVQRNAREAEAQLADAVSIVQDQTLPLAEWRVYATAFRVHRQRRRKAQAVSFRRRSREVLCGLAESLGEESLLRQHMLNRLAALEVLKY